MSRSFSLAVIAWCGLALVCALGCGGASRGALAGDGCTAGALVCGEAVAGVAGFPVLHCLDGTHPTYVQVMICAQSCEPVAGDSSQVQCDAKADWAVRNAPCVRAGATACDADGADGSSSLDVLQCASGYWGDQLDCTGGTHCTDTSTSAASVTVGCR